MASVNGLSKVQIPAVTPSTTTTSSKGIGSGSSAEFREALQSFRGNEPRTQGPGIGTLKFSNHAVERMQTRGIRFGPEQMQKIEQAVQKAAAKGAKNTLLLTDDSAMIVSVKDNTIVTVLDKHNMKENVFTNIDSTVIV